MRNLTPGNFLRWHTESPAPVGLPRPNEAKICSPALVMVPGETYAFYINRQDLQSTPQDISLWQGTSLVPAGLGQEILDIALAEGNHCIIGLTCPYVSYGIYYLKIGDPVTGDIISSPFEIMSQEDADKFSAKVEFRQDNIFSVSPKLFMYPYVDDLMESFGVSIVWKQSLRIRLIAEGYSSQGEVTAYEESETGNLRNLGGTDREIVHFRAADYDDEDRLALRYMIHHKSLTINGEPFQYNQQTALEYTRSDFENLQNITFGLNRPAGTLVLRC